MAIVKKTKKKQKFSGNYGSRRFKTFLRIQNIFGRMYWLFSMKACLCHRVRKINFIFRGG